MKIVIQCAGAKNSGAKYMQNRGGKRVLFVADPETVPAGHEPGHEILHARPDDIAEQEKTWRETLREYNCRRDNPFALSPAYKLYDNKIYQSLVGKYGANNVYILSAGWGLIAAGFLTPNYDITFNSGAAAHQRRRKHDDYKDLCMLPVEAKDDLFFFGGKNYQQFFYKLTENYRGGRFVFYNSAVAPDMPNCTLIKYPTRTRTNWHYQCAGDFMAGKIGLHGLP